MTDPKKLARIERRIRTAGVRMSAEDDRDYVFVPRVAPTLPRLVRNDIFPRVQDQGAIGICTGETMTTIAEAILNTQREYRPGVDELSRRFNYRFSRLYDGIVGDGGATPRSMCRSAKNYGLPLETLWPMSAEIDEDPPQPILDAARLAVLGRYEVIPTNPDDTAAFAAAIDSAIAEGCLVAVAFYVRRWMLSVSGPLGSTGHRAPAMDPRGPLNEIIGGHICPLRGYDNELLPSEGGAYVLQNSWGPDWGDGGLWSLSRMSLRAPMFAFEVRVFREFAGVTIAPPAPVPLTLAQIAAARARLEAIGVGTVAPDTGAFAFAPAADLAYFAAWETLRSMGHDTPEAAAEIVGIAPEAIRAFLASNPARADAWRTV